MKEVDEHEQKVLEQMEFYKAGKRKDASAEAKAQDMPAALTAELKRARGEKAGLVKAVAADQREIEEVRAKFEADKKRWLALKSGAVARPEEYLAPEPKAAGKGR